MRIDIATKDVNSYMRALLDRHDDPVLLAMEELARQKNFPIINRHVGVTVEILARAIGARKVFELGSGYGYSAFWFARAVGENGEVHCTDGDPQNAKKAQEFLSRANLWGRIRFHVGDALKSFSQIAGEWDVVFDDINKELYPKAWNAARNRIRIGGLYICEDVITSGKKRVTDDTRDERIEAIREHNKIIANDRCYISSILPIGDGVIVALRTH
jgi:predicted O-methyltransferase YrrM